MLRRRGEIVNLKRLVDKRRACRPYKQVGPVLLEKEENLYCAGGVQNKDAFQLWVKLLDGLRDIFLIRRMGQSCQHGTLRGTCSQNKIARDTNSPLLIGI